jgi:tRNA-dihydrouridine synthase B
LWQQKAIVLEHVDDMLHHYGAETGVKIARKHVAWYSKGLDGSADFRVRVNQAETSSILTTAIHEFYGDLC